MSDTPLPAPDRLSAWLDRLPRAHVQVGHQALPVYLATGLVGVVSGFVACVLVGAASGVPLGPLVGLAALCCVGFVAYGLVRRRLLGREETVLLEHLLLVLGGAGLLLVGLGLPARALLDALSVGLCAFLAWGRVGCTVGGCCYGAPAAWGIRYPAGFPGAGPRRLPVQLVEVLTWCVLGVAGALLALLAEPGAACGAILVCYAVVRFAVEGLRGDPRPSWAGLSWSRWLALGALGLGLALAPAQAPSASSLLLGAAGLAGAGLLWATRARWLRLRPPLDPALLDSARTLGRQLREADIGPAVQTWTQAGLVVGASMVVEGGQPVVLLSLSRSEGDLVDAEAALLFAALGEGLALALGRPRPAGRLWSVSVPVAPAPAPLAVVSGDAEAPPGAQAPRAAAAGGGGGYFERG